MNKSRLLKYKDDKLRKTIKNKCVVIGCPNEYEFFDNMNHFCKDHQPNLLRSKN